MTLFLSNWSSRKLHGPGRKLTIMAAPRQWEHGEGKVIDLCPRLEDLRAVQSGAIDMAEYRRRFEAEIAKVDLSPWPGGASDRGLRTLGGMFVRDGDTLLCACSREAAAKGECHRVWAAEALRKAGWAIVLDGVVL